MDYKEFCVLTYNNIYTHEITNQKTRNVEQRERFAQKKAIRDALIEGIKKYPGVEVSLIWKAIYAEHVKRKSGVHGVTDPKDVQAVISADNSWKKSSGHAFEETIKLLANEKLNPQGIKIYLQRELSELIQAGKIFNEEHDIKNILSWIKSSVFDLYAVVDMGNKPRVFGCIQTKTSIRDRVTRDREPSILAMRAFFWSTAVVLDGDFLKLPKFQFMVNGASHDYPENGWHGMYVFSEKYNKDRIYHIGQELKKFVDHAGIAATYWLKNRQWFNVQWRVENHAYDQKEHTNFIGKVAEPTIKRNSKRGE